MKLPQHDEDDADGDEGEGFTYSSGASIPQVARGMESSGADVVFDGDEEVARNDEGGSGEVVPYAHRDIKPAYVPFPISQPVLVLNFCRVTSMNRNIMIDDNGEAILMDFGSTVRARIYIADRRQALTQQVSPTSASSSSFILFSRFSAYIKTTTSLHFRT